MQHIELVKRSLLDPAGLTEYDLQNIIGNITVVKSIDYADLYFQSLRSESWTLEDGIIKDAHYSFNHGVGVRAISGDKTGFAYSNDIVLPALEKAAVAARSIASQGQNNKINIWNNDKILVPHKFYSTDDPLLSITHVDKIALLHNIDKTARSIDNRITHVSVSLSGDYENIFISNSDGLITADVRPLVRLNVHVIAESHGRREQGSYSGGGRLDYKMFLENNLWIEYAHEAVRKALLNLEAIAAPAGNMPVVLGPGWPGILLHEAVGHGLEGDHIRKKNSVFENKLGEHVASTQCTIVDDGTIFGKRGSLNIDDEGNPTQCTTLIEKGILKGFMQDTMNARLMGTKSTGNGRRQSYAHIPMPRMTNTYMLSGKYSREEIIESVSNGIYAESFLGGQVDITNGKFVFSASEAYLIENGKITNPIKGATLIGSGFDILKCVSMVGNDLKLDSGVGNCGKDGQTVPVGVGQPTLKIDQITVGGTTTTNGGTTKTNE